MNNYKKLKIRYELPTEDGTQSSILNMVSKEILINLLKIFIASSPEPAHRQKFNTYKEQIESSEYVDVEVFVEKFAYSISNSYMPFFDINNIANDSTVNMTFTMQGQAMGVVGETTRKLFNATSRKEFRSNFFIVEDGDGIGIFTYIVIMLMSYPLGNKGWIENGKLDALTLAMMFNKELNTFATKVFMKLGNTVNIPFFGKMLEGIGKDAITKLFTKSSNYILSSYRHVMAVPAVKINYYGIVGDVECFIQSASLNFLPEKILMKRPQYYNNENKFFDNMDDIPIYRIGKGNLSFIERQITNYDSFSKMFRKFPLIQ